MCDVPCNDWSTGRLYWKQEECRGEAKEGTDFCPWHQPELPMDPTKMPGFKKIKFPTNAESIHPESKA
jgi:hypothetical protein